MMADAFATRPREVAEMIRELIDPSYYNSGANSMKETFLANMYRIVSAAIKELTAEYGLLARANTIWPTAVAG